MNITIKKRHPPPKTGTNFKTPKTRFFDFRKPWPGLRSAAKMGMTQGSNADPEKVLKFCRNSAESQYKISRVEPNKTNPVVSKPRDSRYNPSTL
jgi:hypothetical protein